MLMKITSLYTWLFVTTLPLNPSNWKDGTQHTSMHTHLENSGHHPDAREKALKGDKDVVEILIQEGIP